MTQQTLALVNELLPGATPEGAYSMGLATVACIQAGMEPGEELLRKVCAASSIGEAAVRIEQWIRERQVDPPKKQKRPAVR